MTGTGLQEIKPSNNKEQDTITFNQRSYQQVERGQYFNKLDLIWGYNNIQIKEGKAAFLTNKGLFEPQVMYFGLCNLPGTFQRMMNNIF